MRRTPCALGTGLPLSGIPKGRSLLAARRVNALRCGMTLLAEAERIVRQQREGRED